MLVRLKNTPAAKRAYKKGLTFSEAPQYYETSSEKTRWVKGPFYAKLKNYPCIDT